MRTSSTLATLAILGLWAIGCGGGANPTSNAGGMDVDAGYVGADAGRSDSGGALTSHSCGDLTPVHRLEDSGCPQWLNLVRGRVARNSAGSAVVWSRRSKEGYGLVAGAMHTLGGGWFGNVGQPLSFAFVEPEVNGVLRLELPPADGALVLEGTSPLYSLFHLDLPAAQHKSQLTTILPRHDVFIGLVDQNRVVTDGLRPPAVPDRTPGLVALHDPENITRTTPVASPPEANDLLIVVGYPQDRQAFPLGAMSVTRVLSDTDAKAAIAKLSQLGDEEGEIPYNPDVEVLVQGYAKVGMSGGGAFDKQGRWVGTLVRASTKGDGPQIIRIVKAQYVLSQAKKEYQALGMEDAAAFEPFLDPLMKGE